MNKDKIDQILKYFKFNVSIDKLDDIYTDKEKQEIMTHWDNLTKSHNNCIQRNGKNTAAR